MKFARPHALFFMTFAACVIALAAAIIVAVRGPGDADATSPGASFSLDAVPGGAIDSTRTVPVGVNFSVEITLDAQAVPALPWRRYYITVEYDDVVLDPTGFPSSWQLAPVLDTTGGNLFAFSGTTCTSPPGVSFEDDIDLAEISVSCGPQPTNFAANARTGPLLQLVFRCEAPGFARIGFDFETTYIANESLNPILAETDHIHEAIINCGDVPGSPTPAPTWTPRPTWSPTSTPTATPTISGPTIFSVDAIPLEAIDAARTAIVGEAFDVEVVLTAHGGYLWATYALVIDYGDFVLDGVPPSQNLLAYPPPVCVRPFICIGVSCYTNGPTGDDDVDSATWARGCYWPLSLPPTLSVTRYARMAKFTFVCEAAGASDIKIRGLGDTYIRDVHGTPYNDEQHNATITCIDQPTAVPTATTTPPGTPTATPFEGTPPAINKHPEGNVDNTGATDDLPLANLFLCEDTDGPGPICSGPNEGELTFTEMGVSPEPLGAFEFQIKFDHKIFDINMECVTLADPGPACTLADTPTWHIQLSQQLLGDAIRDWSMDTCFRNVTENYINFACVSTGPVGSGLSGSIALADVTLHPDTDLKFRLRPGNDNGVVRVILDENCELVDTLGHPQPGSIAGGLTATCGDLAVTVRILEGDLDLDCDVDLADAQAIAQRYGMVFGLFLYDPWYDLEPSIKDFDVDAKDIQKVFGRIGSTCQAPIPPQPPVAPPQL